MSDGSAGSPGGEIAARLAAGRPGGESAAARAVGSGGAGGSGGRLFVVATPIGNLGDVTFRALEVLRAVPMVAAEDTRITRRLFARYEITTRLVAHHARNEVPSTAGLLAHLRAGADLALVTDAGTPLVSDPGGRLVAAWAAEGGVVVPIPGASAVLAALVASGVAGARWSFEGFLPRSGRERRERLARLAADERACVLFEAPGRVGATLADLATACGGARPAAVCRELTKLHEETIRGTLGSLAVAASAGELTERGEFAIVVGERAAGDDSRTDLSTTEAPDPLGVALARVDALVAGGASRSSAARTVASETGIGRRHLYVARPDL